MPAPEPDWYEMFEEEVGKVNPVFARYQAEAHAFEQILYSWRRWHWTPAEIDGKSMKVPASATDGIIALARIGIMPPRSELRDLPRGGPPSSYCMEEIKKDPAPD